MSSFLKESREGETCKPRPSRPEKDLLINSSWSACKAGCGKSFVSPIIELVKQTQGDTNEYC